MTLNYGTRAVSITLALITATCVSTPRAARAPLASRSEIDSATAVAAAKVEFLHYYQHVYAPDTVPDLWKSYSVISFTRGSGWVEVMLGPADRQLIGGGARFRVHWGLVADLRELYP